MEEHGEVSVDGILGSGEGDCYEMVASSFRSLQGQALEADFVIFGLTVKYEQENDMFIPAKRCCKCYFMHPYPETLLGYDRPKPGEPSGPASPWNKKYLAGNCSEALSFALLEAVCRRQKEVFTPKLPVLFILGGGGEGGNPRFPILIRVHNYCLNFCFTMSSVSSYVYSSNFQSRKVAYISPWKCNFFSVLQRLNYLVNYASQPQLKVGSPTDEA